MKMNRDENIATQYFSTNDLALATALALSEPVCAVHKENPRRAHFLFKKSKELDELIQAYWQRELRVDPQAYFSELKSLKSRLYNS